MQNIDNLLTVVLPLKGRAAFTFRTMEYLAAVNFPFKLIVADGGGDDAVSKVLDSKGSYPNVNYEYINYPFDKDYSHYYRKMVSAISAVSTPYVALLDNDCFPLVDAMRESVVHLNEHTEYSACRGQHIDFMLNPLVDEDENPLYGRSISIDPVYFDRKHSIWSSFERDTPLARIADWSHATCLMHYNIYRKDILLDAWKFISENECCDLYFCEFALALNALAHGKTKVLDFPFTFRQQNSPESASKEMVKRMDILDRFFFEKWTKDINQLIHYVAGTVQTQEGGSTSKSTEAVRIALKNHFADRLLPYLEKRKSAMRTDEGARNDSNRSKASADLSEKIAILQPKDAHPKLREVAQFLIKDAQ